MWTPIGRSTGTTFHLPGFPTITYSDTPAYACVSRFFHVLALAVTTIMPLRNGIFIFSDVFRGASIARYTYFTFPLHFAFSVDFHP